MTAGSRWRERAAWIVTAAVTAVAAFLVAWQFRSTPASHLVHFSIYPPEKNTFTGPATATVPAAQISLSPDGHAILFTAAASGARPMLWLRFMDEVARHQLFLGFRGFYPNALRSQSRS